MSGAADTPAPAPAPGEPHSGNAPICAPGDHHCVTCSDEGLPMRVVAGGADEGLAVCEDGGGRRLDVLTGLVGPVEVGDRLLVHAGTALLRLAPEAEEAP